MEGDNEGEREQERGLRLSKSFYTLYDAKKWNAGMPIPENGLVPHCSYIHR